MSPGSEIFKAATSLACKGSLTEKYPVTNIVSTHAHIFIIKSILPDVADVSPLLTYCTGKL